ncbi:hypothetical protein [Luteibacter rhizovicinus]|uniref:hypothetical protein n=1 Tax=Luteibacter rhizovicinus TaxID=242606 RepID=UPI0012B5B6DB|nr:hypothetical protein [Luteibacter rhizovicinus]
MSTTHVDYGRLSRATLAVEAKGMLGLPARTIGLHVRCDEPGDMAVMFRGAAADERGFLFTEAGRFVMRLRDARLDGVPVDLGQVDRGGGGVPGQVGASLAWNPDAALTPLAHGHAAMGRDFSASIEITARVDEAALAVGDAARWTTTGSVELVATGASADLAVQAEVQPGRCNVDVVRHLSFGRVRSADLDSHGASTRLTAIQAGRLQVLCDGPLPFAFRIMRDERPGTAVAPTGLDVTYPESQLFGLGKTPAGERIGSYVLRWAAGATSDRGELRATHSLDGSRSWAATGGAIVADHDGAARVGYAAPTQATTGPLAVKALDVTLDATIFIAPKASLSLDEEIHADGLMTIEIIY